jgi:hypothetical protein
LTPGLPNSQEKIMHLCRPCRWPLAALVFAGTSFVVPFRAAESSGPEKRAEVHVGIHEGDIRGSDNRALQAAVDYIAGLGGGTIFIGAGRYQMRNALMLRDRVRVVGVPGKTILSACDGSARPWLPTAIATSAPLL